MQKKKKPASFIVVWQQSFRQREHFSASALTLMGKVKGPVRFARKKAVAFSAIANWTQPSHLMSRSPPDHVYLYRQSAVEALNFLVNQHKLVACAGGSPKDELRISLNVIYSTPKCRQQFLCTKLQHGKLLKWKSSTQLLCAPTVREKAAPRKSDEWQKTKKCSEVVWKLNHITLKWNLICLKHSCEQRHEELMTTSKFAVTRRKQNKSAWLVWNELRQV